MKKLTLSILFLLFLAAFCNAQTCDCKIIPYTPASCFSSCTASLITDSTLEELLIIVELKKGIAEKIVEYNEKNKTKKVQTIEEYKPTLTEAEFKDLEDKIQSLNNKQISYLQTPVKKRKEERVQLVKLNKALDELRKSIVITASVQ